MLTTLGSIARYFPTTYRDLFRIWTEMRSTLLTVLGIALLTSLGTAASTWVVRTYLGHTVSGALVAVAGLYFLTPHLIALFRYLLLGERAGARDFGTNGAHFFAWAALFVLASNLPEFLYNIIADPGPGMRPGSVPETHRSGLILGYIITMGLVVFCLRAVVLLPALAIGKPMTVTEAFQATRRRFWFMFCSALLPLAAAWFGVGFAWRFAALIPGFGGALVQFAFAPMALSLFAVLAISIAAGFYRQFVAGELSQVSGQPQNQ